MKAAAHGALTMIIEWPRPDPTAELIFTLEENHRDATFGQARRRGKPGDAAADHHDPGRALLGGHPDRAGMSRVAHGTAISARHPSCPPVDQDPT